MSTSTVTLIGGARDGEVIAVPDYLIVLETPTLNYGEAKKNIDDIPAHDDAITIETCRYRRSTEDRTRFIFEPPYAQTGKYAAHRVD